MVSSRLAMSGALLLLVAASAWAAEPDTMWYKDRLAGAAPKAGTADYYEKTEVAHQCLQATTYDNCKTYQGYNTNSYPASQYFETDLGCCAGKADKHQEFFRGLGYDTKIGRCWWKLDLLSYAAAINLPEPTEKPILEGTFEVTCELAEHADKCGEPLAEDTILKGWGKVWLENNAAIMETKIETDASCDMFPFNQRISPGTNTASQGDKVAQPAEPQKPAQADKPAEVKAPVVAKVPAKAASADYYSHDKPTLYSGQIRIFSGFVQVVSPSRKVTYKEGAIQALGNYQLRYNSSGENIEIKHVTNEFVAKPYAIHVALRKGGDY